MTKKFRVDELGNRWEIKEGYETLEKPSKEYLAEQEKARLEMEKEQKIEAEKRARILEIKQKLQSKTATNNEIQEILENLI